MTKLSINAKAKVTPTCVFREEESQVDTLVFPEKRTVLFSHSLSLSFSSRRIFRVANGKKRNLCRSDENVGEEIASRLTSQMYLGTYDVEKPRCLVNLTDSRHVKKERIYNFRSF